MELNKSVSNPMFVGAIELMRADDTPEHRDLFVNEMMKAQFLAPAVINPAPEQDENGEFHLVPNSQVHFPLLSTQDGKQFFMAFTDKTEMKKWQDQENQQTFALTFDDYASMLLTVDKQGNGNPAAGITINPYGANVIITKDMARNLMVAKMAKNLKPFNLPPKK